MTTKWEEVLTSYVPTKKSDVELILGGNNLSAKIDLEKVLMLALRECYKHHPELCKEIITRRYKGVDRWFDYRLPLVDHVAVAAMLQEDGLGGSRIELLKLSNLVTGLKFNFPTYFVQPELLEAALQTKITFDIDLDTLHLPFEYMIFVMPKGGLKLGNQDIYTIELIRVREGQELDYQNHSVLCHQLAVGIFIKAARPAELVRLIPTVLKPDEINFKVSPELSNEDSDFIDLATNVVFNLLFAMEARPELVESGVKVSHHKKSRTDVWTPNIIGRKYRSVGSGDGTHASPRMHWRSGHFRKQKYGKGRKLSKIIWIEPVLINPEGGDDGCTK